MADVKKLALEIVNAIGNEELKKALSSDASPSEIAAGIAKIVNNGWVEEAVLIAAAATGDRKAQITFVLKAIQAFQNRTNVNEEGKFRESTRSLLKHVCDGTHDGNHRERNSPFKLDPDSNTALQISIGTQVLFYHLSEEIENLKLKTADGHVKDGPSMIAEAIRPWVDGLDMFMRKVPCDDPPLTAKDANVLIFFDNIDGKGNVLAYGDIGGPSCQSQLRLRFDRGEDWGKHTAESFQCTAAHELGHILGLPHIEDNSALMSPIKNLKTRPTKADMKLAQSKWRAAPGKEIS